MTREEAKELLPIIQAFVAGKQIQDTIDGLKWFDTDEINLEYEGQKIKHRIKPEQKYRPFKNQEECWNEMLKHLPFGWLRIKDTDEYCDIAKIFDYSCETKLKVAACIYTLPQLFDSFIFADGTPFGIKEVNNE